MKLPKQLKQFEMSDCQEIETINLKDTKVEEVSINTCNFVTEIKFPETLKSMRINDMEALESIHLSECLDCKVVELDCLEALKNYIYSHFAKGGRQIHFNIFNAETLIDAKEHPEKYQNLQIRVCGWNVHFVELNAKEQDMYIARALRIAE